MNGKDNLKHFDDPLLSGLKEKKLDRTGVTASNEASTRHKGGNYRLLLGLLAITALAVLGFYIFQAQQQLGQLSAELAESRTELQDVSRSLADSKDEIASLNEGLGASDQKLASQGQQLARYKTLYSNLKTDQEEQTRELAILNVQKADQSDVNALKDEASDLRSTATQIQSDLDRTSTAVSNLEQTTSANRNDIDQTRVDLQQVRSATETNAGDIGDIRRSLEREYYNFELQEKGGYMKVFDVSLSLKDADVRKKQFDMYLLADGKVIRKKDQSINEPILFYVSGKQKPYEVVVTRVDDKLVVGYLSVPKI
ncbi:MAG: hypothetical protein JSU96_06870 [Acidobacteriota bacterium]|nr:MAG: hypothetical protein JSU96_06870 [Acidobacteriota bacterium]